MDDPVSSAADAEQRLRDARASGDENTEASLLRYLATLYHMKPEVLDLPNAVLYFETAIRIRRRQKDWLAYYREYSALGTIHQELLLDPAAALIAYKEAIKFGASDVDGYAAGYRDKILRRIEILERR